MIEINAGGDASGILQAYFNGRKGKIHQTSLHSEFLIKLVSQIVNISQKVSNQEKKQWISLLFNAGFTRSHIKQMGYDIGEAVWRNCKNVVEPFQKKKERKKKNNEQLISLLEFFLNDDNNTQISPQKNYKNKEIRCFSMTRWQLFLKFKLQYPTIKIGKDTFYKILKKNLKQFQKPNKRTDMCIYCARGKLFEHASGNSFHFSESKKNELIKTYENHRKMKSELKEIYDTSILNLNGGECIINIDFKENVALNQSSDEVGYDWYNKPQRTILGITLSYLNNKKIERFYFDIISEVLNHNGAFVITALKKILSDPSFKKFKFTNLAFWMDNAPHFRNSRLFAYFASLKKNFSSITWEFFCENHGKSICDSRFGKIATYLSEYSKVPNNFIKGTYDLVNCIAQFDLKYSVQSKQILITKSDFDITYPACRFKNVKSGYFFEVISFGKIIRILQKATRNTEKGLEKEIKLQETKESFKIKIGTNARTDTHLTDIKLFENLTKKYEQLETLKNGEVPKRNKKRKLSQIVTEKTKSFKRPKFFEELQQPTILLTPQPTQSQLHQAIPETVQIQKKAHTWILARSQERVKTWLHTNTPQHYKIQENIQKQKRFTKQMSTRITLQSQEIQPQSQEIQPQSQETQPQQQPKSIQVKSQSPQMQSQQPQIQIKTQSSPKLQPQAQIQQQFFHSQKAQNMFFENFRLLQNKTQDSIMKHTQQKKCLNDEVINEWSKFLQCESDDIKIMNTFFFTHIQQKGPSSVLKWIDNIQNFKKIIIPIHTPGHWSLGVIDVENTHLFYLDSFLTHSDFFQVIKGFLRFFFPNTIWYETILQISQQNNSYDCGVFVCFWIHSIILKKNFIINQDEVTKYRKHMNAMFTNSSNCQHRNAKLKCTSFY